MLHYRAADDNRSFAQGRSRGHLMIGETARDSWPEDAANRTSLCGWRIESEMLSAGQALDLVKVHASAEGSDTAYVTEPFGLAVLLADGWYA